jgi:hypothetical protein
MIRKPLLERAVELAYSGQYPRNQMIIKELKREGYEHADQHLDPRSVKAMLVAERQRGERDRARSETLQGDAASL